MEYFKGVPITEYCDAARLSVPERLQLFTQVCAAVQHAHQKGIIHRDLKPSNILVAPYDDKPVPKVIDFGLAKAMHQPLTDRTLHTAHETVLGTPLYMSPEQAQLNNLDIDTCSDIYSLGVLLYELLTGTTPLEKKRFKQAAWDEVRRIIREEEPPRPSTRLSSTEVLPSLAACRKTEPAKLTRLIRGELDWIVMKALEKDRNRRYETANGLAMDVQRYLSDEAVHACPPSAGYRLKKFLRRHRRGVLAAGVVLLALLIGIAGTVVGLVRAVQAETRSVLEAENARQAHRRAQENLRLALRVLDDIYLQIAQDRVPRDPRQARQEHELVKRALEFYQEFATQNSADPAVALDVTRARRRVGDIQRLVGQHDGARGAYLKAIDQAAQLGRNFPDQPQYVQELAACHDALGELLVAIGELPAAEKHFRGAVDCLIKLRQDFSLPAGYRAELARGYHGLGLVEKWRGSRSAAEALFQNAIELQAKLAAEEPKQAQYRADLAQMHHSAGRWVRMGREDSQTLQEHLRSAVQLLRGLAQDFPDVPLFRYRLAMNIEALVSQGGSANSQEAADILVKLIAEFPTVPDYRSNLAVYHDNEGDRCWISGQVAKAAKHYSEAHQLVGKLAAEFPHVHNYQNCLMVCLSSCAQVAIVRDRDFTRASELLEQAAALARFLTATYPENQTYACHFVDIHEYWSIALNALGKHAEASTRSQEAERAFRTALEARKKLPNGHAVAADYCKDQGGEWEWYAGALMSVRGAAEAAPAYRRVAALYSEGIQLDPTNVDLLTSLARVYAKLQQWPEALAIREKLTTDFPRVDRHIWDLAASYIDAGHLLQDNNRPNEAAKIYERARQFLEARQTQFPEQTEYRAELGRIHNHTGWLLASTGRQSEAETEHRQALDLYEKLVQVRSKPELNHRHRQELAWTHEWLGKVLTNSNRPQEAEKAFRQAIALEEELNTEFPNQGHLGWMAGEYDNLATLLKNLGKSAEAEAAYREALGKVERLAISFPKIASNRDMHLQAARNLAQFLQGIGKANESALVIRTTVAVYQKLVESTLGSPEDQIALAANYESLANFIKELDQPEVAEQAYRQASALWEKMVASFPAEPRYRDALARVDLNLAHLLNNSARPDEAEKLFVQAITVWGKLAEEHPERGEYRQHQGGADWDLAAHLVAKKRLDEAELVYRQGVEHWQKLVDTSPEVLWYRADQPNAHYRLGILLKTRNRPQEAEKAFREALALEKEVEASASKDPKQFTWWAASYHWPYCEYYTQLWLLLRDTGRFQDAAEACREEIALVEKIIAQSANARDYQSRLATRYDDLAQILNAAKQPQQAEQALQRALTTWEELAAKYPKEAEYPWKLVECQFKFALLLTDTGRAPEADKVYTKLLQVAPKNAIAANNLAWLLASSPNLKFRDPKRAAKLAKIAVELAPKEGTYWNTLGVANYRAGDWNAAITALEKSMELRKGGDSFDWFFLAMVHWQLGEKDKARTWFNQAAEWMDKNQPKNDELRRFRAEATELMRIDGAKE
jgi:tetratricopeptide (TPR) repeat protein